MNQSLQPLANYSRGDLGKALANGSLELVLGVFSMRLRGKEPTLLHFLLDAYRDVPARIELNDVTDISVNVRPPSILRKFIRPQVIPDPGFIVPAVPLPPRLAPLAMEMGLNLSIALKCCRLTTFHAAVVGNENGTILISARSGGGKSTLASALMMDGYRLYSDEFGLLDMQEGFLWPHPRPVSLKAESIEIVKELTGADWLTQTLTGTPKGDIAYRRVRASDIEGASRPGHAMLLLFPAFAAGSSARAKEISKAEALMKLIPSSTNYHLLGKGAFEASVKMVENARAFEITYGNVEDSLIMARDLAAKVGL